jgi:hypothetical protein
MNSKKSDGCVNKTFVLLLCFTFGISAIQGIPDWHESSQNIHTETGQIITFECTFQEPLVFEEDQYTQVVIEGLPSFALPGEPTLPVKTMYVLIPFNHEVSGIQVRPVSECLIQGDHLIKPGQEQVPLMPKDSDWSAMGYEHSPFVDTPPTEEIYDSPLPFPNELYESIGMQYKRGYGILILNVFPVSYSPASFELKYYPQLEVEIETRESGQNIEGHRLFRSLPGDQALVRDMIVNPLTLTSYENSVLGSAPPPGTHSTIVDPTENYQYVIITNESLRDSSGNYTFQDLTARKMIKGLAATIVTVEDIYADPFYNGVDDAEEIRNFIIDAYVNWETEYVLLGGDGDGTVNSGETKDIIVPHRGFQCMIDPDIPADMYYSCLDGSFDYNGNGVYAENLIFGFDGPGGGEVDLLAELYVGRAPVDSEEELSNFVMKTLAYEDADGNPYLQEVLMLGELLWSDPLTYGAPSKDEIYYGSWANPPIPGMYSVTTLYDRDEAPQQWDKWDLIPMINDGYHIINHLGHGNVDKVMLLHNPDVDNELTNTEYFLGYSQGCYCGSFDNHKPYAGSGYTDYDCVVEHLIGTPNGAFAFIANSRFGYGDPGGHNGSSQFFDRTFFDALFGDNIRELGMASQYSKEQNIGFIYSGTIRACYYELTLFGDPELCVKNTTQPDHDIAVTSMSVGKYQMVNDNVFVNGTMQNKGLNFEPSIQVRLLINGSELDSQIIGPLNSGEGVAVNFTWTTPAIDGSYVVAIETVPVSGETILYNNQRSKTVFVTSNPDIWTNPSLFNFTVRKGEIGTDSLVIGNAGFDTLNLTIKCGTQNSVLVHSDMNPMFPVTALQNLGISYLNTSDINDFNSEITGSTWDLVIFNANEFGAPPATRTYLNDHLLAGGKMIFNDFTSNTYTGSDLMNNLGFSIVTPAKAVHNVWKWNQTHELFNSPNTVPNITGTHMLSGWSHHGSEISPAYEIAGFTPSQFPAEAGMVVKEGISVAMGFQSVNYQGDDDSDTKVDMVELYENCISYLYSEQVNWLSVNQTNDSIDPFNENTYTVIANATLLDPGVYMDNITITSNDPDDSPLVIPATLTVLDDRNFLIPVEVGWNLISIPLVPENSSLPGVLLDLDGDTTWTVVQYYDVLDVFNPWKSYATFKPPVLNDLSEVNVNMGVWLYIPDATALGDGFINVTGIEFAGTIDILAGWNLVGYPFLTSNMASDILPAEVDMMAVFNATDPYRISDVSEISTVTMEPGRGYWVHIPSGIPLMVDP